MHISVAGGAASLGRIRRVRNIDKDQSPLADISAGSITLVRSELSLSLAEELGVLLCSDRDNMLAGFSNDHVM